MHRQVHTDSCCSACHVVEMALHLAKQRGSQFVLYNCANASSGTGVHLRQKECMLLTAVDRNATATPNLRNPSSRYEWLCRLQTVRNVDATTYRQCLRRNSFRQHTCNAFRLHTLATLHHFCARSMHAWLAYGQQHCQIHNIARRSAPSIGKRLQITLTTDRSRHGPSSPEPTGKSVSALPKSSGNAH